MRHYIHGVEHACLPPSFAMLAGHTSMSHWDIYLPDEKTAENAANAATKTWQLSSYAKKNEQKFGLPARSNLKLYTKANSRPSLTVIPSMLPH